MRKIIHADTYNGYPLNTTPKNHQGFYDEVLKRIAQLLDYMISRHSQVFFTALVLKFPTGSLDPSTDNNAQLSMFLEALTRYYSRKGCEVKYLWARELSSTGQVHYHVMLLFNGNKMQNAYSVLSRASDLWSMYFECQSGSGLVHLSEGYGSHSVYGGVKIRRNDPDFQGAYAQCFHQASYVAKCFSKGGAPPNVNEFGCSRI